MKKKKSWSKECHTWMTCYVVFGGVRKLNNQFNSFSLYRALDCDGTWFSCSSRT